MSRINARFRLITFLLLLSLFPLCGASCTSSGRSRSTPELPQSRHSRTVVERASRKSPGIVTFLDISASEGEQNRREYLRAWNGVMKALPRRKTVSCWAFADSVALIFEARPSGPRDVAAMQRWLRTAAMPHSSTLITPVLRRLQEETKNAAGRGEVVAAIIVTDGEWNDYDEARAMARNLADEKNLAAILVMPISPDRDMRARSLVEAALVPFGDRLITANRFDIRDKTREFRERVQQAQSDSATETEATQ